MSRTLRRKVVVITGAANGTGAQVAHDLVGARARVAVLDRDAPGAQRLAAGLGSTADVTSAESVHAAFVAAAEHFGSVDVTLANAGIRNLIGAGMRGLCRTIAATASGRDDRTTS